MYTVFLQLQSYLDASQDLVEKCLGFLVDIESSDEGSDGGGLVTVTRLIHQIQDVILMRIPLL